MTTQLKAVPRRGTSEVHLEQTVKTSGSNTTELSDSDVTELSDSQLVEVIDRTTPKRPPVTVPDPPKTPSDPSEQAPETPPESGLKVGRSYLAELPTGSIVDETYEIESRLSSGSMGEVYVARHVKLDKRVAIKVIGPRLSEDGTAIERFAREARTLAKIQHPAIVAVEHVGELADGRAYFVMEYLRGESLFERLQRGRVPLPEALRVLDQVARGLEAAHAQGVVHRDLKPDNTFLVHLPGEPPVIKLLDFGLAKLQAAADRRAESTQRGMAIGTPKYMSPEQSRGADVDHRADVYALGCVAYELVLDRAPFPNARTAPELFAAHLCEAPPSPRSIWPEIPPQLDLALSAMLAKEPGDRPTLAQIRKVIAEVCAAAAKRGTGRLEAPRAKTRSKSLATTTVGALLVLIGGVAIGTIVAMARGDAWRTTAVTPAAPTAEPSSTAPVTIDRMPGTPAPRPNGTGNLGARTAGAKDLHPPPAPATEEIPAPRPRRTTSNEGRPNTPRQAAPQTPRDRGASKGPVGMFDAYIENPQPSPAPTAEERSSPPASGAENTSNPPAPAIDKNQTLNPFSKKHDVNP